MENFELDNLDETQLLINKLSEVFPTMNHERRVAFFLEVLSLFGGYMRDNGQFLLDISEDAEKNGFHVRLDEITDKLSEVFPMMNHERRVAFFLEALSLFGGYMRDNGQFLLDISEDAEKNGFYVRLNDPQLLGDKISELFPAMGHDSRVALFSKIISVFGPYIHDNAQFLLDIFDTAENSGAHILPVHYYSPIPEINAYPTGDTLPLLFEKNFNVDIPPPSQDSFFSQVCQFAEELVDVSFDKDNNSEMRWNNGMFGVLDSCVYYAMIREYRPSLVLEIGSGFSTLVASKAALKNTTTLVECVEPYPVEFLVAIFVI
jgi:hypothetical protein